MSTKLSLIVTTLCAVVVAAGCERTSTSDAVMTGTTGDGRDYVISGFGITDDSIEVAVVFYNDAIAPLNQNFSPQFVGYTDLDDQALQASFQLATGNTRGEAGDLMPGPDVWALEVKITSTGSFSVAPTSTDATGSVVIDRVRYVGGNRPIEWTGRVQATFDLLTNGELTIEGGFTMYNECGQPNLIDTLPQNFGHHCGQTDLANLDPLDDPSLPAGTLDQLRTGTFTTGIVEDPLFGKPCPEELVAPYTDDLAFKFENNTMTPGTAEPLSCMRANAASVLCGSSHDGVSAAGCTWNVDVISQGLGTLRILGVADEGCDFESGRYCHSVIQ